MNTRLSLNALLFTALMTAPGRSQAPPAPKPNPQAPTLNMLVPVGMQRGGKLELSLTGANLSTPTGFWTSFPAKVTIPTDNNNGNDAGKLRVQLDVPKDAPLGFHSVRLTTTRGMSNLRLFCIDDLPQVMEVDTNHAKTSPQSVPVPSVVVGRADAEMSDWFKIAAKAGQRISFEILGRRLGSGLDPQLTLFDARTGREMPAGHSNDAPGLQTDPRLTYTFKEAGDYLIEVRDVMYRGGGDFWYRLRIGDFPCATTPLPMAAKRGSKLKVSFAGPTVEGVAPVDVAVPNDPAIDTVWVTPKGVNGLSGWPVALAVSDLDEVMEQEPNNEPAKANRIAIPCGVTGRFLEKGDIDHYVFAAKKGQRLLIDGHTHDLYSPTEVYMVLRDTKGTQVAASNPAQGARIDFNPPADGDYTLAVEHLHYWGGPAETYRITVTPYEPGFDLSVGLERWDVAPGGFVSIPITAIRRDYAGPIEVSVTGHPGLTGQVTIPTGQPAQPNQPAATLLLSAKPDVEMGPYQLRVEGKATINGKIVTRYASVQAAVSQALANLSYPPRDLAHGVAVAVTEKPPFMLAAKFDQPEGLRGGPVSVTITAARAPGFADEITIAAGNLPANVTAVVKNIPKEKSEVKVQLTPAANAALGQFPISFTGKAKHQNKDFTVASYPTPLVLVNPFELTVAPAPLKLTPGGKGKLTVTAARKAGYQGPINVELRNLPANVTAAKATIAMGQTVVEMEVMAAENAVVGEKGDVNVLGIAMAAGNQQVASANFTVGVAKK
jgi:hypothetical protein